MKSPSRNLPQSPLRSRSAWHGPEYYFGLHYDLHATEKDTELGMRCSPKELVPMLRLMGADFVQTDCKGHPGYTSWFSKVPGASVPPKLKKDAMKQWREATRQLGLQLHCHYSGIWDKAAGAKRPGWCSLDSKGRMAGAPPVGQNAGAPSGEKMCPRGGYLEGLMIPQMKELIDRYQVDGFWIDGDLWAVEPCYCPRCKAAYTKATGRKKPPLKETDPDWPHWWNFTRESFNEFVTRYCNAVHAHKPGVLVCSNWLQTFRDPGEPHVPTDWISGDNAWVNGLDGSRCEARFLSTRGKHWDIMLWNFYCSHGMGTPQSPWTPKPPQMLMQEAAVLLSFGGSVQIYESATDLRDGRLVEARVLRMSEVGRFVKKRRALCQGSESIPQIAVLHSETHLRQTANGKNLMWGTDVKPVQGAVFALLENHYGVDLLDEWALLPRLREFPAVFVPERHALSKEMVEALKGYVRGGGKMIVTGAESFGRFGSEFLGVTAGKVESDATYYVPATDTATPLFSKTWRLVKLTTAKPLGFLGRTAVRDAELLEHPAATLNRVARGAVAYIPADVCRDFEHNRYPLIRAFIGEVTRALVGKLPISVQTPVCVDVALRRQGARTIIHLVNRASGIPNQPNNGAIDEIPSVGPIVITVKTAKPPASVRTAWEGKKPRWTHKGQTLTITLPCIHIHEAIVISQPRLA
ncbi:MAG: alpha-L-fucosidase [Verrucomicrobia bacterium]|nr:alpha-L-fucosidase [Verrucomicrobiota bacterium]